MWGDQESHNIIMTLLVPLPFLPSPPPPPPPSFFPLWGAWFALKSKLTQQGLCKALCIIPHFLHCVGGVLGEELGELHHCDVEAVHEVDEVVGQVHLQVDELHAELYGGKMDPIKCNCRAGSRGWCRGCAPPTPTPFDRNSL